MAEKEVIVFNGEFCKSGCISVAQIGADLMREAARRDDLEILAFVPQGDAYYRFPKDADPWELGDNRGDVRFFATDNDSVTEKPYGYINGSFAHAEILKRSDYFLCVNQRITACAMLQKLLSKPFVGFTCDILNYISLQEFGDQGMFGVYPSTTLECMLGMVMYWNIFQNDAYLARTTDALLKVFRPSVVQEFRERSVVINLGVDGDAIDAVSPAARLADEETLIFVWGGRTPASKGLDVSLDMADALFRSGKKVLFDAHLIAEQKTMLKGKAEELSRKYPFVRVSVNTPQRDFWAAVKAADVYVSASKYESYGLSYTECLRCGVPVIFFERPWVRGITPSWYPYVVRSKEEAVSLLTMLYADRLVAAGVLARMRDFIDAEHNRAKHRRRAIDAWVALSRCLRTRKRPRSWEDVFQGSV